MLGKSRHHCQRAEDYPANSSIGRNRTGLLAGSTPELAVEALTLRTADKIDPMWEAYLTALGYLIKLEQGKPADIERLCRTLPTFRPTLHPSANAAPWAPFRWETSAPCPSAFCRLPRSAGR